MIPNDIFTGNFKTGHIQGIAIDKKRGFLYCSFTTVLTKHTLDGTLVGSVTGLCGHLGCIAYDEQTDRVYGSLELKHDAIGQGILKMVGKSIAEEDAFYLVSFECRDITSLDMNAEESGVMKAVYLSEVVRDYSECDEVSGKAHRYGCSGIDGTAVARSPMGTGEKRILIAYGIFTDLEREDNDHQVILEYDPSVIDTYGRPLSQTAPHHSGPDAPCEKYFVYTGNTHYGIQNLEYDEYTNTLLAAVYMGRKPAFTPFRLFFIDMARAPEKKPLLGRGGEVGMTLSLARLGEVGDFGISGSHFPLGATGIASLGAGYYMFSENGKTQDPPMQYSNIRKFRLEPTSPELFIRCEY